MNITFVCLLENFKTPLINLKKEDKWLEIMVGWMDYMYVTVNI